MLKLVLSYSGIKPGDTEFLRCAMKSGSVECVLYLAEVVEFTVPLLRYLLDLDMYKEVLPRVADRNKAVVRKVLSSLMPERDIDVITRLNECGCFL